MLSLYEQLQNGTLSPTSFMFAKTARRLFNLELSTQRDIESTHSSGVSSLDIEHVEYRYLLSGSKSGSISVHDLYNFTGKVSYTCKALCTVNRSNQYSHDCCVDTVQWYPFDTGMFTSSGMDAKLKIWDTNVLKPVEEIYTRGKIYSHHVSTISTNHTLIATAMSYPSVVLVDMKSGSQCHELSGHKGNILSVRWSPSAEYLLASGGSDNKVFLWDIRSAKGFLCALDQHNGEALSSRRDLITAHNGMVNSLCFSTDGLYLMSYGTDDSLKLWDVATSKNTLVNFGKVLNTSQKHVQMDVCYNATVPVVFVPSQSKILVYEMFTGSRLNVLIGHFSPSCCCVFRSYYHELYSAGCDHHILIWTPDVKRELAIGADDDLGTKHADHDNWAD